MKRSQKVLTILFIICNLCLLSANITHAKSAKITPGWHIVNGHYYYYSDPYTVLKDCITPDGYYVNTKGQWLEGVVSKGIDVSRYQGTINWNAVKNDGIDFAMVRVSGSSKYNLDAKFHENMKGANNAGLKVGVYIYSYATTPAQAVAEANFVLNQIKNYTVTFPIAIDIEDSVHRSKSPSELAAIANAFCSTIEAAGYYPIVYGSKKWFSDYIATSLINYDLWVAQYNDFCTYGRYQMWQASSTGRVNGIAGNVDINYLYKDYASIIVQNGWATKDGYKYYHRNYSPLTGMQSIDGDTYYFDSLGRMITGWVLLDNIWYYFYSDGKMATGWIEYKNDWYYLNPDGKMATGWITIPSGTYYLNPGNGDMLTGWQTINGSTHYFNSSGGMMRGWVLLGHTWYFMNRDTGILHTGWLELDGDWFYLMPDNGKMLANCNKYIDGKYYSFDPDGYWIS